MRPLVLAIGVALMLPSVALAKSRVALVPFEGDNGGAVEDLVADVLDGDYTVAGPSQVRRTIDKLGLESELSERDLKKLANELEAEAIVRGDVTTKNGHKVLHVRLFVNGKRIHGFKVEFASTRSDKMKQALKDKLLEKLAGDDKPRKKKPAEEEADTSAKTDKADKPDKGEKAEGDEGDETKPGKGKGDETADTGDKPAGGGDEEDADRPKKKKRVAVADDDDEEVSARVEVGGGGAMGPHTANRAAIRVDFGPSASRRQLTFTSRVYDQAPKPYENSVVPGGRVAGDLYPAAFGNPDGLAAGLGIGGDFDQTIGLKLQSTAQTGTKFPVVQKHWSVGARLRIVVGKKPTSPSITFRGGYFHRMFEVDRSALMAGNIIDLPDVFYRGFNPGADLRFPIGGMIALVLGGEAYLVTDAGEIQKANQYGQARVTGGQGYAGLDIVIAKRFAVRVVGEFAQIGYSFTGNGEMTNNRDGVPTTKDIGGAADRYMGGALTFGVMY